MQPFVNSIIQENRLAGIVDVGESTLRKRARDDLYALARTSTVYGQVNETMEIQGLKGNMKFTYLNMFAFFSHAAASSKMFFLFMKSLIARYGVLHCSLYTDGVTPRNKLRPDKAGSFEVVRFTLLEFPHWMRTRTGLRWLSVGYAMHKKMKDAGITVWRLLAMFLKTLFRENDFNMQTTGMILRHEGEEPVFMKMEFACTPQDERALKACYCLTGASGSSPCGECDNCMGRCRYFEDDSGFAHVWSPEYQKFKKRTHEQFFAMADDIVAHTDGDRKRREQTYGMTYEEGGLIFDLSLRPYIRMPWAIYWDHMHCFTASGGMGQYEVNQFARRIRNTLNMPLSDLDDFAT